MNPSHAFARGLDDIKDNVIGRFWSKVKMEDGNWRGCWTWTGQVQNGYGVLKEKVESGPSRNYRGVRAHRISYELHVGRIPDGYIVRHTCGVKNCVNPNHLTLGTHVDNMRDQRAAGKKKK